jgi:DNA-binding MarR family transcriptional regulator
MVQRIKSSARRKKTEAPLGASTAGIDRDAKALLEEVGLSRELGFVMRMAQLALFEDLSERLSSLKLSLSQFSVLRLIHARPGLTQQRIGDALRIKKTNLVALVGKLEERGLLSRTSSATDGRAYALCLTTKGERTMTKAMDAVAEHLYSTTNFLGPKELDAVLKSLWKVVQHVPYAQKGDA